MVSSDVDGQVEVKRVVGHEEKHNGLVDVDVALGKAHA